MKDIFIEDVYKNLDRKELVVSVFNPEKHKKDYQYSLSYKSLTKENQKCVDGLKEGLINLGFDAVYFKKRNSKNVTRFENFEVGYVDIRLNSNYIDVRLTNVGYSIKIPYAMENVEDAIKFIKRLCKKERRCPYSI